MSSIFLSHSHADRAFVRRLADDLRGAGARVWVDEAEIQIGDSLIEKIRQGIDEMEYVGAVLSPSSIESKWVQRELDVAMNQEIGGKQVKVLPIMLQECAMPGFLVGKLYADFRNEKEYSNAVTQLLKRLGIEAKTSHYEKDISWKSIPPLSTFQDATLRFRQLENKLAKPDRELIRIIKNEEPVFRFYDLCLTHPNGIVCTSGLYEEIRAGEHVLIAGNSKTGNILFKAILGLWPWGQGSIEFPGDDAVFFMPQRPYLPIGTLRAAISFPSNSNAFGQDDLEFTLDLAGLEELVTQLDNVDDWETNLETEQIQRLSLVRLLLHKPKWVLIQKAFDSLAPEDQVRMTQIICRKLPDSGLMTITKEVCIQAMYFRRIVLC